MFGDSACAGFGSQTPWYNNTGIGTGWAHELAAALHHDFGHEVLNVGQGFLSIVDTAIQLFRGNVAGLQPDVVVVSFGMGHERLATTQTEVAAKIIGQLFVDSIRAIVNLTIAIGALPVVCESYPHNQLNTMQYTVLKETNRHLEALGVPILSMLAAVDDGTGRWKEELSHDAAHPNAAGHHEMFRGFVPSIAQIYAPEQIEANRRTWTSESALRIGQGGAPALGVEHRSYMIGAHFPMSEMRATSQRSLVPPPNSASGTRRELCH